MGRTNLSLTAAPKKVVRLLVNPSGSAIVGCVGQEEDQNHTAFAARAFRLSDLFKQAFPKPLELNGRHYNLVMMAPEGGTTGGGVQSVQHVLLVPMAPGTKFVIASMDQLKRVAEIKRYDLQASLFQERFKGQNLPFERLAYVDVVMSVEKFFTQHGIEIQSARAADRTPTGSNPAVEVPARSSISLASWFVFGAGLLLAAAGLAMILLRH